MAKKFCLITWTFIALLFCFIVKESDSYWYFHKRPYKGVIEECNLIDRKNDIYKVFVKIEKDGNEYTKRKILNYSVNVGDNIEVLLNDKAFGYNHSHNKIVIILISYFILLCIGLFITSVLYLIYWNTLSIERLHNEIIKSLLLNIIVQWLCYFLVII